MHLLNRKTPPDRQPSSPFVLETPHLRRLSNHIPCYSFFNSRLELIHFLLRVDGGTLYETRKGITSATFSLLNESAPGHTSAETEDFLDYHGTVYKVSIGHDYVDIQFIIPKQNVGTVLEFVTRFLSTPKFREESLVLYRQREIQNLQYNDLKSTYIAKQNMYAALLHPDLLAARRLEESDLRALSVQDMETCHSKVFAANHIKIFVAGHIDEDIHDAIERVFGNLPSVDGLSCPRLWATRSPEGQVVQTEMPDRVQSSLILCRKGLPYLHPDRRDFSVLTTLLGGYFGSRLMQNLRETHGYTYGVHCSHHDIGDASIFYIKTEVNADKTEDALLQCRKELSRLQTELVPEEELDTVKNYMIGSWARQVDGTINYMKMYAFWFSVGVDEQEYGRRLESISQITPERVRTLARSYLLPERFTTVVAGKINP
ncbi:MAG: insulinase family protein [Bacteroidales bacterium]|nr:insulinase family protein [Bacteroidales bacterium]